MSVILPVIRPHLAQEALTAIANQTWAGSGEVIVIHDGGAPLLPVPSPWCVRSYGVTPQVGPSVIRNLAIDSSDSDVIAFCDDDDVWEPNHLDETISLARTSGGVIYTDALVHHVLENWRGEFRFRCSRDILRQTNPIILSTIVLPRRVWEQVGGFDPALPRYGDWDWMIRASEMGIPILRVPHITATYRFSGQSASSNSSAMAAELDLLIQKHHLAQLPCTNLAAMVHDPEWDRWRAAPRPSLSPMASGPGAYG